jgi:long-chain acyl-CoA synthetase
MLIFEFFSQDDNMTQTNSGIHASNVDYENDFDVYLGKEKHLGLMIRDRVEKFGGKKIAVRHKPHGEWIAYTWAHFGEMIEDTAKGLLNFGVNEFDMVGIFASNSAWWAVADYACYSIRACSVPVYPTNSEKELEHIVNDAKIQILFIGNQEQYDKAVALMKHSPTLKKIIVFDPEVKIAADNNVIYLDELMVRGRNAGNGKELSTRIASAQSDDLATLIYTSGTTGEPKGVMLTHRNWLAMLFGAGYHIKILPTDVNLAFLPLSHVFERAWSYFILCCDAQVDYCHDTKAIKAFLKESRPHYMCSVPRMWEKIHATVLEQASNAPANKQKIFKWAFEIGDQYQSRKRDSQSIGIGLTLKHIAAKALVLKKIRAIFGGRTKIYNCGGSAFSSEISEFFFKAGILLLQGYGLTECFVISVANQSHNKFGTCGPVVPLMNVRISAEGEIQAKGPSMTQGYWKKPELSKELFTDDGWIKTGDAGIIDEDGYVVITDRIKDLMKTSGGKYISPQQIENLLTEDFYIEQAATIGDGRKYVSALVVPSRDPLQLYAKKQGIPFTTYEDLIRNPNIIQFYRNKIDELTKDLGQVEKVKKFTLLSKEFTQQAGEITPTQKLRRKIIKEQYKDAINEMYRE